MLFCQVIPHQKALWTAVTGLLDVGNFNNDLSPDAFKVSHCCQYPNVNLMIWHLSARMVCVHGSLVCMAASFVPFMLFCRPSLMPFKFSMLRVSSLIMPTSLICMQVSHQERHGLCRANNDVRKMGIADAIDLSSPPLLHVPGEAGRIATH